MVKLKKLMDHFGIEMEKSQKPIKVYYMAYNDNKRSGHMTPQTAYITGINKKEGKGAVKFTVGIASGKNVEVVGEENAAMVSRWNSFMDLSNYYPTLKEAVKDYWVVRIPDLQYSVKCATEALEKAKANLTLYTKGLKEAQKKLK